MTRVVNWKHFGLSHDKPDYFYTSQWQSTRDEGRWYRYYRYSMVAVAFLLRLLLSIITDLGKIDDIFNPNRWAAFWLLITTGAQAGNVYIRQKWPDSSPHCNNQVQWFLEIVSHPFIIYVTVFHWNFVFARLPDEHVVKAICEGLTTAVVLIDVFVSRSPRRPHHFIYSMLMPLLYAVITGIHYSIMNFSPEDNYRISHVTIDWSRPDIAIAEIAGCSLICVLIHFFLCCLVYFRQLLCDRCCSYPQDVEDDVEEAGKLRDVTGDGGPSADAQV